MRLSVTFTPGVKGTYTVGIYNNGAGPYFHVDDVQVERGEAPSNVNLVEDGNLQHWDVDWTMGPLADYKKDCGLFSTDEYAYSECIGGDAEGDGVVLQQLDHLPI